MKHPTQRLPRRPSNRTTAVGAVALAAVLVAALALSSRGGDADAEAQESETPTVALERRDLAEQVSVDGSLGYGDEAAVINRLSGTITWLPDAGSEIRRGRKLFEVDDEPVLLMYGTVPAYRNLSSGVSEGPDVKQLEANLSELGFDEDGSMTVDEEFTSATSAAVADWQESLGLDETGSVELGSVIFQDGARRVSSVDVELGASADAASGSATGVSAGSPGSGTTTMLAAYQVQEVDPVQEVPAEGEGEGEGKGGGQGATPPKGTGGNGTEGRDKGTESPAAPPASAAAPPAASASGGSTEVQAEAQAEGSSPSTQVMTTTSVERAVSVELDPEQVGLAERGGRVDVTLPDGDEVKGRISSVGTVAEVASADTDAAEGEATEDATIEVMVELPGDSAAGALDEAPVTVDLTQEVRKDVFVVPVAALIGTAGGEYAILAVDGTGSREIAVEPGLFADGYVEVEGEGLEEGLAVEVPEE